MCQFTLSELSALAKFSPVKKRQPIILIGPAYPLRGGIADFNESFAKSLVEEGYPVELVSFYLQYPGFLFPGKSQKSIGGQAPDLPIHNLISSVNPLSWYKTAKAIGEMKPQMVVIRFWIPFMGPALGTIAKSLRKQGIKVIGLVDNAIPHESRPFDKKLSHYFFKRCSGFFTLSRSVADDLKMLVPGAKTATSPHPVYDTFGPAVSRVEAIATLKLNTADKYILFFGFVRAYKGLDLLLQAMGAEEVKKHSLKLIVAGEFYDDRESYDAIIKKHGLEDSVIIHDDFIPQDKVRYYFAAANLVAQTYRSATQSGVTQIAYHFGRPMLVTNVGGLAEIIPNNEVGLVVEPNPDAIGMAITRFFEEDLEARFAAETARQKSLFSWQHFTTTFLKFAGYLDD